VLFAHSLFAVAVVLRFRGSALGRFEELRLAFQRKLWEQVVVRATAPSWCVVSSRRARRRGHATTRTAVTSSKSPWGRRAAALSLRRLVSPRLVSFVLAHHLVLSLVFLVARGRFVSSKQSASFESWFDDHCANLATVTQTLFKCGAAALLGAVCVYVHLHLVHGDFGLEDGERSDSVHSPRAFYACVAATRVMT
jgi:hypothetical protein